MIDSKDISVVVQGAVGRDTAKCLASIRRHLPNAEIILSTWDGTDVTGLTYDKLVLSADPGAIIKNPERTPNNSNRQLVSTQAGLAVATRKYTLKLRSDLIIKNTGFLKYFDAFPARNKKWAIFQHRVIISTLFSREKYFEYNFLFHPSDFWFFGLTADICDYWLNTPMQGYSKEFKSKKPTIWTLGYSINNNILNYVPEMYYCINWVWRHFPNIVYEDYSDDNPDAIIASKNILYNNFIFIGPKQSGIMSHKHRKAYGDEYSSKPEIMGLITYELFQKRYREYCDKDFVPIPDKWRYLYKAKQNFKIIIRPFEWVFKYMIHISRMLYYLVLFTFSCFRNDKRV